MTVLSNLLIAVGLVFIILLALFLLMWWTVRGIGNDSDGEGYD